MGRTVALFTYKLRFFFGPSLRGRFGPLSYAALILIFLPSGFLFGLQLGNSLRIAQPAAAIGLLSTPLAALLSFGLLYALGAGITAHASEFDFFFTADVKPREYLFADLLFQFVSLFAAGGLAASVAAVAMVRAVGLPIVAALPLFAILVAYTFFVLMTAQLLVVLRVRLPRFPVRAVGFVLFALSLMPAIGIAQPAFPVRFEALPLPSTAFARLGAAVLGIVPVGLPDLALAIASVGAIVAAWIPLSGLYIVHGLRPTLSAGFGQVDLRSRLEMQRRMTAGLGRVTTRVRLRTDRGGTTGLMTRLHLVRIWRDGSIVFVILFASIGILPAGLGASPPGSATVTMTQTLTFLLGLLAMNWAFYERENLWLVVTAARPPGPYFRGLMIAFATIGLGMTAAFLALVAVTRSFVLPIEGLALSIAAPIAAAFVATALLTRVKLRPSALSFAALGIFFLVSVGGFLGGLAAQAVVFAVRLAGPLTLLAQAAALVAFLLALSALGLWTVTRLAAAFRF